ncbi:hypothetical protein RHGRI_028164 [Rhododendron griersonianum]|uniref:tRNA pseudouridine(55) synthase n=1 Tax=Rhododendron griersonianum TaxID=479676 RepID=A0AAV6IEQ1_9ERIC|nr:hypothetical protein RHGRI_028164 [Rhododendron griersonianum]
MNSLRSSHIPLLFLRHKPLSLSPTTVSLLLLLLRHSKPTKPFSFLKPSSHPFSTTLTQYPLQYDMIISRPDTHSPPHSPRRRSRPREIPQSSPADTPESEPEPELGFDDWVDRKLTSPSSEPERELRPILGDPELDKSKRKYYNKRRRRIQMNVKAKAERDKRGGGSKSGERREKGGDGRDEKGLVFFEEGEEGKEEREKGLVKDVKIDISEKKVEEFFKCLKKVPNKDSEVANAEPFVSARSTGLPSKWDSPTGNVVLVNKPKGWTSFTVCGKLRRLVNVKKVGHAGTLDPMATGLLIVCVGKATKVVDRYQGMIKGYSGVFRLGEATSTWDADSPVIQREPWEHIKDDDIKKAAASFCGEIWQVPPMFSAIKVGGERVYEKARRGESIELSPRRISIFQFEIERSLDDRQNLIFRVVCSKGTYIRSLCADLGKALGSCAHLTALRRDSIGQYSADDAWDFKELEEAIKNYL